MAKLKNSDIVAQSKGISDFPAVVVDQTNVHISDIIKRNLAGEQVLGNTKLAYDYLGTEQFKSMEVNPFSGLDFDLDDVIIEAAKVGKRISDLQDDKGRLDQQLAAEKMKIKQAKQKDAAQQAAKLEEAKEPAK